MSHPWDDDVQGSYDHDVVKQSEDIVKCINCGKMASSGKKLKMTKCSKR